MRYTAHHRHLLLVTLATIHIVPSASRGSTSETWPDRQWLTVSPESKGVSSSGAADYVSWLTSKTEGNPFGTVVVKSGKIVIEHYGSGASSRSAWEIGSIRKAVGSALLGMAIREKRISLEDRVYDLWPAIFEPTGTEKDKKIRVEHLFNSSSGWKRPEPPATSWVYNNSAFTAGGMVLGRIYQQPADRIADLARRRIGDRIGATSWHCYHYSGTFSSSAGNPGPKLAIDSSLRDLARFGYLWLRGGRWKSEQLIPSEYVQQATRNQVADIGGHYGYCWFVNDGRKLLPNAPHDAYFHVGNGREGRRTVLLVIPSMDLVATVGTHAASYDITDGYKSVPVPHVNQWIGKILNACHWQAKLR